MCLHTAPKSVRHKLIEPQEKEMDPLSYVRCQPLLPEMDRSSRQKISRDRADLSSTISQLDTADAYRLFRPATAQYTFSSRSCATLTRVDHILGNKIYLKKIKRTEITQWLLSDHIRVKLEINKGKIVGKS